MKTPPKAPVCLEKERSDGRHLVANRWLFLCIRTHKISRGRDHAMIALSGGTGLTETILLCDSPTDRIYPSLALGHVEPHVDDRRRVSGIIFVIRNGPRWREVPASYKPRKIGSNRLNRWNWMGVIGRNFIERAIGSGYTEKIKI